jgi:hypothetical protein
MARVWLDANGTLIVETASSTYTPGDGSVVVEQTSSLKVRDATAWMKKPVNVWSGSAWVNKPVKRWNGSAWIQI